MPRSSPLFFSNDNYLPSDLFRSPERHDFYERPRVEKQRQAAIELALLLNLREAPAGELPPVLAEPKVQEADGHPSSLHSPSRS